MHVHHLKCVPTNKCPRHNCYMSSWFAVTRCGRTRGTTVILHVYIAWSREHIDVFWAPRICHVEHEHVHVCTISCTKKQHWWCHAMHPANFMRHAMCVSVLVESNAACTSWSWIWTLNHSPHTPSTRLWYASTDMHRPCTNILWLHMLSCMHAQLRRSPLVHVLHIFTKKKQVMLGYTYL